MKRTEKVTSSSQTTLRGPEDLRSVQDPSKTSTHISVNTQAKIPTEEKCKDADLNERYSTCIPKICNFSDGVLMMADAVDFKITKSIIDILANFMRLFLIPRTSNSSWGSFLNYFYYAEKKEVVESSTMVEIPATFEIKKVVVKREMVIKRWVSIALSTCNVILKLKPQLALSTLPHIIFALEAAKTGFYILEIVLNLKNLTKDGYSKIIAALCYQVITCATFAISYGAFTAAFGLLAPISFVIAYISAAMAALFLIQLLAKFYIWLEDGGLKDTTKVSQSTDKLLFKDKIRSFFEFGSLGEENNSNISLSSGQKKLLTATGLVGKIYSFMIGLHTCYAAFGKSKKTPKMTTKGTQTPTKQWDAVNRIRKEAVELIGQVLQEFFSRK
ncbi:MAG: hypothetical protein LBD34_02330 [Puniceicoccales bacterium]|jgi:hypothetical protein|nr:hypothetical protein [Puniceicoccales bacterium]